MLPQTEPSACQARTAFPSDRLRRATRTQSIVRLGDALVVTDGELAEGTADSQLALRLATAGAGRAACLRSTC